MSNTKVRNDRIASIQKQMHYLDRKDRWDESDHKYRDAMKFELNNLLINERLDSLNLEQESVTNES